MAGPCEGQPCSGNLVHVTALSRAGGSRVTCASCRFLWEHLATLPIRLLVSGVWPHCRLGEGRVLGSHPRVSAGSPVVELCHRELECRTCMRRYREGHFGGQSWRPGVWTPARSPQEQLADVPWTRLPAPRARVLLGRGVPPSLPSPAPPPFLHLSLYPSISVFLSFFNSLFLLPVLYLFFFNLFRIVQCLI